MAEEILIPPGKTQTIQCPEGAKPLLKPGQFLPQEGDLATFVVVSVSGQSFELGPLKSGRFVLNGLCKSEDELSFRIESPNPQDVKQMVNPLGPQSLAYPSWLWVALVGFLFFITAIIFIIKKFLSIRHSKKSFKKVLIKRNPIEKMEDFLAKIEREKTVDNPDFQSSQFLYSEAILRLRALLQKGLGFKNRGATITEFMGELKAQVLRKKGLLPQQHMNSLESLFMQAKQVIYARENPDLATKKAFQKSVNEIFGVLKSKLPLLSPAPESNKKRISFPRRTPKK